MAPADRGLKRILKLTVASVWISAAPALAQLPALDSLTPDQVAAMLGQPASKLDDIPSGSSTWHYDTPLGPFDIFVVGGVASPYPPTASAVAPPTTATKSDILRSIQSALLNGTLEVAAHALIACLDRFGEDRDCSPQIIAVSQQATERVSGPSTIADLYESYRGLSMLVRRLPHFPELDLALRLVQRAIDQAVARPARALIDEVAGARRETALGAAADHTAGERYAEALSALKGATGAEVDQARSRIVAAGSAKLQAELDAARTANDLAALTAVRQRIPQYAGTVSDVDLLTAEASVRQATLEIISRRIGAREASVGLARLLTAFAAAQASPRTAQTLEGHHDRDTVLPVRFDLTSACNGLSADAASLLLYRLFPHATSAGFSSGDASDLVVVSVTADCDAMTASSAEIKIRLRAANGSQERQILLRHGVEPTATNGVTPGDGRGLQDASVSAAAPAELVKRAAAAVSDATRATVANFVAQALVAQAETEIVAGHHLSAFGLFLFAVDAADPGALEASRREEVVTALNLPLGEVAKFSFRARK